MWVQWKKELTRLKALDIKHICPGHGKVCEKSVIDLNIQHLDKILNEYDFV